MSLKTWKEEFYPTEAEDNAGSVEHSLRKWIGIREVNIHTHGLEWDKDNAFVLFDGTQSFSFNVTTCSLCQAYNHHSCRGCPLSENGLKCYDTGEPYDVFLMTGDPEPMIKALEKAMGKKCKITLVTEQFTRTTRVASIEEDMIFKLFASDDPLEVLDIYDIELNTTEEKKGHKEKVISIIIQKDM